MTTHHDTRPERGRLEQGLTHDPALHHLAFVTAFNARDIAAVDRTYEKSAVLVPKPGHPVTGAERVGALRHLMGLGAPIESRTRHAYIAGDIALLVVDWSIHGTAPNGVDIRLSGTAADVARRGPDGLWRYVIDNPYGTA